jgi:hypothetical protein
MGKPFILPYRTQIKRDYHDDCENMEWPDTAGNGKAVF